MANSTLQYPLCCQSQLHWFAVASKELQQCRPQAVLKLFANSWLRRLSPSVDTKSIPAVASALDPRSRGLAFLNDDQREDLRHEILCCCLLAAPDALSDDESIDDEPVAIVEPPAKRPANDLDLFFGEADEVQVSTRASAEQEVATFFGEKPAPSTADPLAWWHTHASRFPLLSQVARQVLCVTATSVPSERVFSAAGHIVSKLRAALSAGNVDALIFLQQNRRLRSTMGPVTGSPAVHPMPATPLDDVLEEEVDEAEMDDMPPLPDLD